MKMAKETQSNTGAEPVETTEVLEVLEQPKKRRARTKLETPIGTKKEKITARQLTGILMLTHTGASEAFSNPFIRLDESEAGEIAGALVDVLNHYDFEASAKTLAWCNLVGTMATIYGLKFMIYRKIRAEMRREPSVPNDGVVVEFPAA
jgi:hypothetical protein